MFILLMIDYCPACCLLIHVARCGTQFEAREPVGQAVRERFRCFCQVIARGAKPRHDHGSQ